MPRKVAPEERLNLIKLMRKKENGEYKYSQYDIQKMTKCSRPFIRKVAQQIGHQFPRNGIEINGVVCMCALCGSMFRRSPSKAERHQTHFCSPECKIAYYQGAQHPSWKEGQSANTYSQWIMHQSEYKEMVQQALAIADYKCEITGVSDDLAVHHLNPKALSPENALDIKNVIVINRVVHDKVHQYIRNGFEYDEAVEKVKKEYAKMKKDRKDA